MYVVGDEFAFDFVPEDREAPVFTDEKEKGVWSEFAEEGLSEELEEQYNKMPDEVEMMLSLEADAKEGK